MTTNAEIANTIYQQLGGRRFALMTGAKNFLAGADCLSFQLPPRSARNGANYCKITLTPADDYKLEFARISWREHGVSPISEHDGVYCDNLRQFFESETGLATSLGVAC